MLQGLGPSGAGHAGTAGKLAIVAAVVSALAAIPSAWVATQQALKAQKATEALRIESAELRRIAQTNDLQLAEARRLAGAAERANQENLRMANAAGLAADQLTRLSETANEQRRALVRSSSAAEELAATARKQTEFAMASYQESTRPRIVVQSSQFALAPNQDLLAEVHLENMTPNTPTSYWLNVKIELVPIVFSLPRLECSGRSSSTSVIGRTANFRVDSNQHISAETLAEVTAGKKAFLVHGTVCYERAGKIHVTRICRMGDLEGSRDCSWGNAVE